MNAITIQNVELPVIEIEGQRVVTLSMVDKVHQRPEGTARIRKPTLQGWHPPCSTWGCPFMGCWSIC